MERYFNVSLDALDKKRICHKIHRCKIDHVKIVVSSENSLVTERKNLLKLNLPNTHNSDIKGMINIMDFIIKYGWYALLIAVVGEMNAFAC